MVLTVPPAMSRVTMGRCVVAMGSARGEAPGKAMGSVSVTMSTVETAVTSAMRVSTRASKMTPNCSALLVTSLALDTVQEVSYHWSIWNCILICYNIAGGPKACTVCAKGYIMNTEHGCMVS